MKEEGGSGSGQFSLRKTQLATAGFEDGGMGHEPSNTGSSRIRKRQGIGPISDLWPPELSDNKSICSLSPHVCGSFSQQPWKTNAGGQRNKTWRTSLELEPTALWNLCFFLQNTGALGRQSPWSLGVLMDKGSRHRT